MRKLSNPMKRELWWICQAEERVVLTDYVTHTALARRKLITQEFLGAGWRKVRATEKGREELRNLLEAEAT